MCDGGGGRYYRTVLVEFCLSGGDGKRPDEVRFVLKAASGSLSIVLEYRTVILGTVPVTGILSAFLPSRWWLETRKNVVPDWRDSDH